MSNTTKQRKSRKGEQPATTPVVEAIPAPEATTEAKEAAPKRSMAEQLRAARGRYVPTLAAGGRKSLSNGDQLAIAFMELEPAVICHLADVCNNEPVGTHMAKYEKLNRGQQRMNAGNRVRGSIKRGDRVIDEVLGLLAEIRKEHVAAAAKAAE